MRRRIGRRGRSRKRHWLPFRLAFATVCAVVMITIASVHIVFAAESDVEIRVSDEHNRNNDIDITRGKSPVQSLQQSLHVKLKGQDSNSFISSNTNRKLQARTNKKTKNNQRNGVNKNNGSRGTNNTWTNANKKRTSNTTVKGAHLQSNKNAARNGSGGTNRMKTANKKTATTANKLLNNMEQLSGNRGRSRGGNNNKNNRRRSSRSNNNWNNSGKKNRRSRNNNRWRASRSGGKFRGNRWGSSGDKWSSGSLSDWESSGSGKSGKSGGSSGGSQSWSSSGDDSWSSDAWTTRKKRDSWSGVVQWNMEKQCPCTYIKSPHPVAWGETKQMIKVCTCEPTYMPTTYHPT